MIKICYKINFFIEKKNKKIKKMLNKNELKFIKNKYQNY